MSMKYIKISRDEESTTTKYLKRNLRHISEDTIYKLKIDQIERREAMLDLNKSKSDLKYFVVKDRNDILSDGLRLDKEISSLNYSMIGDLWKMNFGSMWYGWG